MHIPMDLVLEKREIERKITFKDKTINLYIQGIFISNLFVYSKS